MTDNLEIHKVKERIKMTNMKQTQDDRTIQPFNCSTIQRVKAYAFTLAETLIVIGIIGVVAALTLPNLNHATGDKEKVTKVKKIYASLTDAVDRAQAIYGDADTWFTDMDCFSDTAACSERFAKRVTEFMKVSKDCGINAGCFSEAPLLLVSPASLYDEDGNEYDSPTLYDNYYQEFNDVGAYMVSLSDGMSLSFYKCGAGGDIFVDIDGPNKGKNKIGDDIFGFDIDKDNSNSFNVFPGYTFYDAGTCRDRTALIGASNGGNFTAWVIENGNLDYLKCLEELNWETQTSCK